LSTSNKQSQNSKGIRFIQLAVLAIALIAGAGAWYGFDKAVALFHSTNSLEAPESEASAASPDTARTPDGYSIATVPSSADKNRARQRSRAAEFAQHVASSKSSGEEGSFRSSSRNKSPEQRKEEEEFAMPEWARIISPNGSTVDAVDRRGRFNSDGIPDYVQLYPAFEAGYVEEVISNGEATDMSALLIDRDVGKEVLYNGAVSAAHDLGNFFYLLTVTQMGNLRFYFGVERLRSDLPTFIEFELNQAEIRVASGVPWWNIKGYRLDGDLLIRANFIAGNLTSVELAVWHEGIFHIFETDSQGLGQGCKDQFSYIYCLGTPPIDRSAQEIEVWDEDYLPVVPTLADSFFELGIDMSRLMGSGTEFSGVYVRTPEDVLLTSFSQIGINSEIGAALL
jgi:hypothetical protein